MCILNINMPKLKRDGAEDPKVKNFYKINILRTNGK